jgi:S1-C subfamily serine protease
MHMCARLCCVASVLTLGLSAAQVKAERSRSFPEKIQALRPSVVEVHVDGKRRGTGFFVSSAGHVLTAFHVVGTLQIENNAISAKYYDKIEVVLHNGRKLIAEPAGSPASEAAFSDLTVLKVTVHEAPFLTSAPSSKLPVGSEVYFMGFPLDLPSAVTYRGTVSAKFSKEVGILNGKPVSANLIQVQAPIAKGFSGSPLLDYGSDKVVGVVTLKLGGINPGLQQIAEQIVEGRKIAMVRLAGVDPNAALFQLITVLDLYLSAGAGFATSTDPIQRLLKELKGQTTSR